jgi:hypothetical protein
MSAPLEFTWDSRDLEVFRGGKMESAVVRAFRLAGNQAARSLRKDEIAFARSRKSLQEQVIVEDQSLSLPSSKTHLSDLVWRIWVRGRPVPVSKFPHSMSGLGTIVTFGGSGGTQLIASAFVARMRSGHMGVFRRTGKARLPIQELFSSRLPRKFGDEVMVTYGDKTYRKLESAFGRGLTREVAKLRRKGEA